MTSLPSLPPEPRPADPGTVIPLVRPAPTAASPRIARANERFLRRGKVTATVAPPVRPEGSGWHAGIQLRDQVRKAILERVDPREAYLRHRKF